MKKEKRTRLANREGYKFFSMHFGVFCGVLTILGLVIGVYSYYKTIKPVLDFENLKIEVSLLEGQNSTLEWENTSIQKVNSELETKGNTLTSEIADMENQLSKLRDEAISAQAQAYMYPIIYESMMDNIFDSTDAGTVKEFALAKLDEYSEKETSKNQEAILVLLKQFINDEITSTSKYTDLFDYSLYMLIVEMEEMGIDTSN